MGTATKGLIAPTDMSLWDGVHTTFSRLDSTGGTQTLRRVGYEVDALALYGVSATATNDSTLSTASEAIGSREAALILSPGTWTISDDLTIAEGITIVVPRGAVLSVSSGKTLTVNGSIDAGMYKIFDGSGTVAGNLRNERIIPQWWGAVADGVTACATAIQAAIDATPTGGCLVFPDGDYKVSTTLTIIKYIELKGAARSGFQQGSRLVFDDTVTGIKIDTTGNAGYIRLTDLCIWGELNPSARAGTYDPNATTFGSVGVHYADTVHSPSCVMRGVQIGYFDTGIVVDSSSGTVQILNRFNDVEVIQCNTGVALMSPWNNHFVQCRITDNNRHGVYCSNVFGCHFTDCDFELNGVSSPNFPITANSEYYGFYFAGTSVVKMTSCYFEDATCFVKEGAYLTLDNCTYATTTRFFGSGDIVHNDASPNLIPSDVTNLYEKSNYPELTDETYYHRMQKATGTNSTALIQHTELSRSLSILDVTFVIVSLDLKIVNGYQDGSFDIDPYIQIKQSDASTDSSDKDLAFDESVYDWTDGNWHTINYVWFPRYGVGRLNSALDDIERLTFAISINSSDFSANNLDAHIRNPALRVLSRKMLTPHLADRAGLKAFAGSNGFSITKKSKRLNNLSGASVNWTSAIESGSVVFGLTCRVTEAITGATSFDVGDGTTVDLFQDGIGVSLGTSSNMGGAGVAFTGPKLYTATTNIVVTGIGGSFSGGGLDLELYFIRPSAP